MRCFLLIFLCLLSGCFASAQSSPVIKDTGQKKITFDGQNISLPAIRPTSNKLSNNDHIYIEVYEDKSYKIYFTIGPCQGQYACLKGSYAQFRKNSVLDKLFLPSLFNGKKEYQFDNFKGYVIPSEIAAYPSETLFVWEDNNILHVIGSKNDDVDILIESAKSLYSQAK